MTSFSIEKRVIRKFGGAAFFLFGSLCAVGIWRGKTLAVYFFGSLALLGAGFIILPGPLEPLYRGWLKAAHRIGKAVTAFVLVAAYYFVITPTAWLKRLFGGRPLPLKPDLNARSYWVTRTESAQPRERFKKRF